MYPERVVPLLDPEIKSKKKKEERKEKRKKLANCQIVLAKQIRTTNNESRLVRFDRLCIL